MNRSKRNEKIMKALIEYIAIGFINQTDKDRINFKQLQDCLGDEIFLMLYDRGDIIKDPAEKVVNGHFVFIHMDSTFTSIDRHVAELLGVQFHYNEEELDTVIEAKQAKMRSIRGQHP